MAKICVIGAGISGLATAKTFLAKGHDVTLFEECRHLGGVWNPDRTYPELTTQTPRDEYSFSDFPMPADYPQWPSAPQMYQYLSSYADHFGITPRIRCRRRVTSLVYDPEAWQWAVTTDGPAEAGDHREEQASFDFVVVGTGVFNRPYVPPTPGLEAFRAAGGTVLHSAEATDPAVFDQRRVVVVGFQKSAADLACVAVERAAATTLVYRRAMWKVPRYWGGVVHIKHVVLSRFSESMFEPPDPSPGERLLHTLGKPLVWSFWRSVELLLKTQFRLRACDMVPDHPIESQISCALSMAQNGFYDHIRHGRIDAQRATVAELQPGLAVLSNGVRVPADVVVFGTGWTTSLPFADETLHKQVIDEDGYYRLYRNLLPPDVPQLGFVGYNSSLYCQISAEVGARWLAEHFERRLRVPSPERMHAEIAAQLDWFKAHRPLQTASFHNTCISPFEHRYADRLLRDMAAATRVGRNPVTELFKRVRPADYAELMGNKLSAEGRRGSVRTKALRR